MALTLAEAAKLSNDVLVQGVYESVLNVSDITLRLPFQPMVGNALSYNRENVAPTVAWRAVGAVWTEDAPTFTQVSTELKILGGDADIDNYIQMSRSNIQDQAATVISLKAKAAARELDDTIINGSGAGDEATGLKTLIPAGQQVSMGVNGLALTLAKLDELIDQVKGGVPDAIVISRRDRRSMNNLFRASGASMETRDEFGRFIQHYNGIPLLVNDYIAVTDVQGASGAVTSSIYAVRFGQDAGGFEAIFNGGESGDIFQIEDVGTLETKDAKRWRVKAYTNNVLYNTLTCARLLGVMAA